MWGVRVQGQARLGEEEKPTERQLGRGGAVWLALGWRPWHGAAEHVGVLPLQRVLQQQEALHSRAPTIWDVSPPITAEKAAAPAVRLGLQDAACCPLPSCVHLCFLPSGQCPWSSSSLSALWTLMSLRQKRGLGPSEPASSWAS